MGIKRLLMVLSLAMGIPSAYAQNSAGVGDIGSSGDETLYVPLYVGDIGSLNKGGSTCVHGGTPRLDIGYHLPSGRTRLQSFYFSTYTACEQIQKQIEIGSIKYPEGKIKLTVTPGGDLKNAVVVSKDEGNDLQEGHATASCKFMDDGLMAPVGLEGFGCRTDLSARALSCETEHGVPFAATGICSRGQSAIDCFNGTQTTQNGQSSTQQKGAQ